jgi:hypothetical protein
MGVTMFSHWICFIGYYLRILVLRRKSYIKHIADIDKNITNILDKEGLLDEFIHIANISKTRMGELDTKSLTAFERWSEIFKFVRSECISFKKHATRLGILFCLSSY